MTTLTLEMPDEVRAVIDEARGDQDVASFLLTAGERAARRVANRRAAPTDDLTAGNHIYMADAEEAIAHLLEELRQVSTSEDKHRREQEEQRRKLRFDKVLRKAGELIDDEITDILDAYIVRSKFIAGVEKGMRKLTYGLAPVWMAGLFNFDEDGVRSKEYWLYVTLRYIDGVYLVVSCNTRCEVDTPADTNFRVLRAQLQNIAEMGVKTEYEIGPPAYEITHIESLPATSRLGFLATRDPKSR